MEERDQDPLLEVSRSIAEDAEVDWDQREAGAATEEERKEIQAARLVARVHSAHRHLSVDGQGEPEQKLPGQTPSELVIDTWGRLELRERIDGGATAEVFRAFDPQLAREVALKLLHAREGQTDLQRVIREARLSARVQSRHVAHVYGVEEHDGRVGIVMELVRGRTLRDIVLQSGRRGAREAALIGMDLCRALAAVHAEGVLHRDIKAQNVMRAEGGRYVLVDFGIGQESDKASELRSPSGTPLYLSPEVFEGGAASVQSDLYSLGVLLFYLVCGDFPVSGASVTEIRAAHRYGRRQHLRDLCPDVPAEFVRVVERAVAADPAERFGSAGEMERELHSLLHSVEPTVAAKGQSADRKSRWKLPFVIAASVLMAASLVLRIYPGDPVSNALLAGAQNQRLQGHMSAAGFLAASALKIEPNDPLALMTLEICSRAEGDLERAAILSRKAYENRKPEDPVTAAKIEARYALNRLEMGEFERQLEIVLDLDREDPDAPRWLTLAALEVGDYGKARKYARQAEKHSLPDDPVGRSLVALVSAQSGRGEEALRELEHLEELWVGPTPPYFDWIRGFALLMLDEFDQALEVFGRLAQSEPAYASNASFFKAQAHVLKGDLGAAEQELSEGAGLDKEVDSTRARNRKLLLLHEVLLLQDRNREAMRVLEMLLAPNVDLPASAPALRDIAVAFAGQGGIDKARSLQERIVSISRENGGIDPLERLALQIESEIAIARQDWAAAEQALKDALDGRRGVSQLISEAHFWMALGRCEDAAPKLSNILRSRGLILHDYPASWWLRLRLDLTSCSVSLRDVERDPSSNLHLQSGWLQACLDLYSVVNTLSLTEKCRASVRLS